MRSAIRWFGFFLIAAALMLLPVAIWMSGPWWNALVLSGLAGGVLLAIGLGPRRPEAGNDDGESMGRQDP